MFIFQYCLGLYISISQLEIDLQVGFSKVIQEISQSVSYFFPQIYNFCYLILVFDLWHILIFCITSFHESIFYLYNNTNYVCSWLFHWLLMKLYTFFTNVAKLREIIFHSGNIHGCLTHSLQQAYTWARISSKALRQIYT